MKYIIAINKRIENNENDYFSDSEVQEIEELLQILNIDFIIINDELKFLEYMNNAKNDLNTTVLNLTRRGSFNNKKVLVHSYCDLRNIKCISSSAFAVNLARNKRYFPIVIKKEFINTPKNFQYDDLNQLSEIKLKVLLKRIQSAASIDLSINSVGYVNNINGEFFLNSDISKKCEYRTKLNEQLFEEFTLQEFINGYEVEVPFIIIEGKIEILGAIEIITNDGSDILTEELSDSYSYSFKNRMNDVNYTYLTQVITHVVLTIGIEYYGRIDFRIKNFKDITTYYIFDIATTPYFIAHSSFQEAFKINEKFSSKYQNIIHLLISL